MNLQIVARDLAKALESVLIQTGGSPTKALLFASGKQTLLYAFAPRTEAVHMHDYTVTGEWGFIAPVHTMLKQVRQFESDDELNLFRIKHDDRPDSLIVMRKRNNRPSTTLPLRYEIEENSNDDV
jgi:hypothetical protein